MNEQLDEETLNKHFKEVTATAPPPVKLEQVKEISAKQIKHTLDTFWEINGVKYHDIYQTGKLLAAGSPKDTASGILDALATVIQESIKISNAKTGITSENLRNHFQMLSYSLKLLGDQVNTIYARNNNEIKQDQQPQFDAMIILALLSGYIAVKVYAI